MVMKVYILFVCYNYSTYEHKIQGVYKTYTEARLAQNTNNNLVKHVLDELYCRLSYSIQKDMPLYINEAIEFAEESFKRKQEILKPLDELIMLLEQNKAKGYNFWEKFFNAKSEITQREALEMMEYIGSNLTLAQDKEEILHMLKRVYEEIY